jgi:hypothetical protein
MVGLSSGPSKENLSFHLEPPKPSRLEGAKRHIQFMLEPSQIVVGNGFCSRLKIPLRITDIAHRFISALSDSPSTITIELHSG